MTVQVLGAAAITDATGREPSRPERKARELLTVLTLRAPEAVEVDELATLLWDDPPTSATKTLRAHVSRLRAALGDAGVEAEIERSGNDAYRLVIDPNETDVGQVAAARMRARELRADGRPDSAATVLADARDRWRGDPELPPTVAGAALAQGWRRERRQLVEEHLRCVVEGTDPGRALGELERLTSADPLDEPLVALAVDGLQRVGRQTEALRLVDRARRALAEVGLEPGAPLLRAESGVFAPPADLEGKPTGAGVEPAGADLDAGTVRYATGRGHTAYLTLSDDGDDLVVLNPAMLTIDGILDDPRPRRSLARLAEHARVVCFDRHGIGLSDPLDPGRPPLDQWTDDVLDVLDALGIRATSILANFDTGLIALDLAARHPERVRSLVLVHCYATYRRSDDYPFGRDPITTEAMILDATMPASPEQRLDTVGQVAPSMATDEAFRAWWNRVGQRAASPQTAATIRTIATTTDLRHVLPSVQAPTLVVHRRGCVNVDIGHARYLADHLPRADFRTAGGTDSIWFTDTGEVVDHALDFLRSVPRPG